MENVAYFISVGYDMLGGLRLALLLLQIVLEFEISSHVA